jgi:hypothetical protein
MAAEPTAMMTSMTELHQLARQPGNPSSLPSAYLRSMTRFWPSVAQLAQGHQDQNTDVFRPPEGAVGK